MTQIEESTEYQSDLVAFVANITTPNGADKSLAQTITYLETSLYKGTPEANVSAQLREQAIWVAALLLDTRSLAVVNVEATVPPGI